MASTQVDYLVVMRGLVRVALPGLEDVPDADGAAKYAWKSGNAERLDAFLLATGQQPSRDPSVRAQQAHTAAVTVHGMLTCTYLSASGSSGEGHGSETRSESRSARKEVQHLQKSLARALSELAALGPLTTLLHQQLNHPSSGVVAQLTTAVAQHSSTAAQLAALKAAHAQLAGGFFMRWLRWWGLA